MSYTRTKVVATLAACGSLLAFAPAASAVDEVNTKKFREQVTVNGILQHQRALQRIANLPRENPADVGTRASGTPGYEDSVQYVKRRLERAGYEVTEQEFTFPFYREISSSLTRTGVSGGELDTAPYEYSGSGDVTGRVVPALNNVVPAAGQASTAGCAPGDFAPASTTAPEIALVQRGTCPFRDKADNAFAAGYDAVIIFNQGNTPERTELFVGTLSPPLAPGPVLGLSYDDAVALIEASKAGDVVLNATAEVQYDPNAKTKNLLADTEGGDPDRTIVVGGHLDSVAEGPGINDNGSGVGGILEIAEEMAENDVKPRNRVRFAFWGAEEAGLLGSEYYVQNLDEDELNEIYANLNFDMIGSPNYVNFVYDGDGSDTTDPATGEATPGPPGSAQLEALFLRYFTAQGLATRPTAFDQRSDYDAFADAGIPAGGLFSGAEGIKTADEAADFGGTAGVAYDPCYHAACDTITNVSTKALFELGDAAAHAVLTLARTRTGLYEDGSRRAKRSKSRVGRREAGAAFDGKSALR